MSESKKKFSFQNLQDFKFQDLKFPGHEVVKNRLPKAVQLAEAVADEWKKDGDFNGLPVGHPITQVALGLGLRKAKDIEKKLEEKGIFTMAQIGLEYAKVQAAKLPIDKLPGSLAQFFQKPSVEEASVTAEDNESIAREGSSSNAISLEEDETVAATHGVIDSNTDEASSGGSAEDISEVVTEAVGSPIEDAPVRHKNRQGKQGGKNSSRRPH